MAKSSGTRVEEFKIGPYIGGINRYSDQSAIADDELVDCVNFDIDLDGSLKSRPPWSLFYWNNGTKITSGTIPPESYQKILGTFVYEETQFVIFNSNHSGVFAAWVLYVGGPLDATIAKITDGDFSKAIRYDNEVYLVPGVNDTANNSSLGTGAQYSLNDGLVTLIPNMPRGYAAAVYKDRLWISGRRGISNQSRLYFSDLADFNTWPSVNFFDIAVGDGDAVHDLAVYQDNILIFKDNATYVLTYDQGPAQAVLQVINTDVGAMGPDCVVAYENSIFVLQYNAVYEMVNYNFTRVSVKIPFEYDATVPSDGYSNSFQHPFWISLVGDRLVCRFYNRLYVYHLRLRAWTRWDSEDENIKYLGPIVPLDNTNTNLRRGFEQYVATSALSRVTDAEGPGAVNNWTNWLKIYYLEDHYEDDRTENGNKAIIPVDIKCSLMTKAYDIGLSHRFKRLMHWGVDTITGRDITGTLYPYSIAFKPTWSQLHVYKWSELNTWRYPLFEIPSIAQSQPIATGTSRRYVRFPKSIRFRLIQFQIDMVTSGNITDGPARLYSITTFIGAKQLAGQVVN